jgi:hypothetical protein
MARKRRWDQSETLFAVYFLHVDMVRYSQPGVLYCTCISLSTEKEKRHKLKRVSSAYQTRLAAPHCQSESKY